MKKIALTFIPFTLSILLGGCSSEDSVSKEHAAWAEKIYQAGQSKKAIAPLTAEREIGVDEAYRIQAAYNDLMEKAYGRPTGYKVAYASRASQEKWNIDAPTFGTFFADQKTEDGGSVKAEDFILFHIESEVAFTIGQDIKKPVKTAAELMPYLKSVHTGLDVPDNRFDKSKSQVKVADVIAMSCATHTYVLGDGMDPEYADFQNMELTLSRDGKTVYSGAASNVLGDPREAVLALIRHLISQGSYLKKGDVVLTGAVSGAYVPKEHAKRKGTYIGNATGLPPVKLIVE